MTFPEFCRNNISIFTALIFLTIFHDFLMTFQDNIFVHAFTFFSMTVYTTHCRYMMENNSTFIVKCKHTQWLDNSQLSVAIRVLVVSE